MGRVKEHYHQLVITYKTRLLAALEVAEYNLDLKEAITHLTKDNLGLETLEVLLIGLEEVIQQDPEFFLTCKFEHLRARATQHAI